MSKLLTAMRVAFTLTLLRRSALLLVVVSLTGAFVFAQGVSSFDGTTPSGMSPGAPAGSYALSGFDNVNLYNGNLNFHLPLLNIGGRGKAGYTMMQTIDSKQWIVNQDTEGHFFTPEFNWWTALKPELSPGVMNVRTVAADPIDCTKIFGIQVWYRQTMTRLTFTAADGTEYELHDALTNGAVIATSFCNPNDLSPLRRGKIWVTGDGSAASFVSDDDFHDNPFLSSDGAVLKADGSPAPISGWLLLRDGTRYRIDNRKVTRIRDANGNQMDFLAGGLIQDTINRKYTVSTDANGNDTISFRGFNNASRQIKILRAPLSTLLRSDYPLPLKTYKELFQNLDGSSTTPFGANQISAIELPDGRKYQFRYNYYGELAKVILPTGGAFEYDWEAGPGADADGVISYTVGYITGVVHYKNIYRRVKEKRVYSDANSAASLEHKTIFTVSHPGYSPTRPSPNPWTTTVTVKQEDAAGTLLSANKHYFYGSPTGSLVSYPFDYPEWKDGKEFKTEALAADSTTVLREVSQEWRNAPGAPVIQPFQNYHPFTRDEPPNNSRLVETITRLRDVTPNQYSKSSAIHPVSGVVGFDEYNNQTDLWEYDFADNSPPTTPVRHTVTSYLKGGYDTIDQSDPPASIHIRSLPIEKAVYEGTSTTTPKARMAYEYDTYTEGLKDRANLTGHRASYNDDFSTRGNLTQVTNCLLQEASCTSLSTRMQYDIVGNVIKITDPLGRHTQFFFEDTFGTPDNEALSNTLPPGGELNGGLQTFAFATKTESSAPFNHTTYVQYDYYIGKPVNNQDANGVITSGNYLDALDRPTQLTVAVNHTALKQQTTFSYNNLARMITTTSDQNTFGDNAFKSEILYDGLGRTIESRIYEPGGFIRTTQSYDALGRAYRSDNPLRSVSDPTDPDELRKGYSLITYDILSRVSTVKTYDKIGNLTGTVLTQYAGSYTTVTDQADKVRRSKTDGLGRLVRVDEPNAASALGTLTAPNQPTTYTYDVLNNLTQVSQGVQVRRFAYDSLKRLIFAANPEQTTSSQLLHNSQQWAAKYEYDNNSNLVKKTDSRTNASNQLLRIDYAYDELNRLRTRTYVNDPQNTPTVNYTYDNLPNAVGKLTQISSTVSTTDYSQFDALGRVLESKQTTAGNTYTSHYEYLLNGSLKKQTYPSGRVVNTTYDTAGRINQVSGSNSNFAESNRVYASQINYTAHGAAASLKLGNNLYEHMNFNSRLQPTQIGLGTSASNSTTLQLDYTYGVRNGSGVLDTTKNNGNIESQRILLTGLNVTQLYAYDSVNRLQSAEEKLTDFPQTQQWKQAFSYDRFGNRNFATGTTLPNVNPTFDANTTTNRFQAGQGYDYDKAGNITTEPGNKSYLYDGDNRQSRFTLNGSSTNYRYDGDGRRVKREDPDGTSLIFVYNAMGQLIAEYDSASPAPPANTPYQTSYLTTDHLGSTRVVTKGDGTVRARYDFLPFGEDLEAGLGGRTSGQGYGGADTTRQKFTGHEFDEESKLHFMQARYCSSAIGRFMSADSVMGTLGNPQSLNLYCYVMNNPLAYVDPTGHAPDRKGKDQTLVFDAQAAAAVEAGQATYADFGYGPVVTDSIDIFASLQIERTAPDDSLLASFNRSISSFVVGDGESLGGAIMADHSAKGPNVAIGQVMEMYLFVGGMMTGSSAGSLGRLAFEMALSTAVEEGVDQGVQYAAGILVYRGGSRTEDAFTPRPDKDVPGGISTFDTIEKAARPGEKVQVIDTSLLKELEAVPDSSSGHVSIRPGNDTQLLKEWAGTKKTGNTHRLTLELLNAVVNTVRRGK
jgi:RHS repeat-associated protein